MELSTYEQQMKKAIAYLENGFAGLQIGRATTGLVENLNVTTDYGTMKLNTLAHITVMDTTTLKIEPRDKASSKHIANAIYEADLGVGLDNQGSHILVKIPALTQSKLWEKIQKLRLEALDRKQWQIPKSSLLQRKSLKTTIKQMKRTLMN